MLALLQDRQGFIWAATQDGLNRYDGYSFTVYKHDPQNPDSLSQSVIAMAPKSTNGVKENNMMSYLKYYTGISTKKQHYKDEVFYKGEIAQRTLSDRNAPHPLLGI